MKNYIFHRQAYHTKKIDTNTHSSVAEKRYQKLLSYQDLIAEGCTQKTALKALDISRATYYRWKKRFDTNHIAGLENESRRPRNVRTPLWSKDTENLVIQIRKRFPLWGKNKIAVILKKEHSCTLSASTIGRILHSLFKRGIVKKTYFYYGRIGNVKHKERGYAQRWKYGMKASIPGELIQMDHCVVTLNNCTVRHFKAVCPITKISVEQVYDRATSQNAADFLYKTMSEFPFKIQSIQVDGGSEFMGKFEIHCQKNKIKLFVLPPRSPKYNAHVERGNSTVKYEFYQLYDGPAIIENIRDQLKDFVYHYNRYRPHQALHYQTPLEYYLSLEAK